MKNLNGAFHDYSCLCGQCRSSAIIWVRFPVRKWVIGLFGTLRVKVEQVKGNHVLHSGPTDNIVQSKRACIVAHYVFGSGKIDHMMSNDIKKCAPQHFAYIENRVFAASQVLSERSSFWFAVCYQHPWNHLNCSVIPWWPITVLTALWFPLVIIWSVVIWLLFFLPSSNYTIHRAWCIFLILIGLWGSRKSMVIRVLKAFCNSSVV